MQAVITDLDRTLLRTDKTLSDFTRETLHLLHKQGILLIAATARPKRSIETYIDAVPWDALVMMNGARVALSDREIFTGIPTEDGQAILNRIYQEPSGFVLSVEMKGGLFSNVPIPEWNSTVHHGFPALPDEGQLLKILVSAMPDFADTIAPHLPSCCYYTVAHEYLIQIMGREATKFKGICHCLAEFDLAPSDCLYFGDDFDDIEPLRKCGMGLAVSNAIPEVLAAADRIIGSNEEDGVAKFLRDHFRI